MNASFSRPSHGGNLNWAAALAGCSPSDILDFSASINPLGPPASAMAALQASLGMLCHYPDPTYAELRQALGQAHQISPDWVLPGNGSAELLTWASRELAELSQTCLLTPAFGDYLRALKAFQAKITVCPIADFSEAALDRTLQPPQLPQTWLDKGGESAGLLLNNPHNPTGLLWSVEQLLPWLDHFALVVVDEAFMDFLPPNQQQSLIDRVADFPNLVILRSLTKFYSIPGLRLGYAIAHPERLNRWQQWRDPWSVNSLAAAVAVAVMSDQPFQQQTWDWLQMARAQLFEGMAQIPALSPFPGCANYLLVQTPAVPSLQRQLLQQHRMLIRDCLSFPELGDRYFRVAVRRPAENQRLLTGLAEILPDCDA